MSALDDARAVLARVPAPTYHDAMTALAALVAECESERAQLGGRIERLRDELGFYANYSGKARRALEDDDAKIGVP